MFCSAESANSNINDEEISQDSAEPPEDTLANKVNERSVDFALEADVLPPSLKPDHPSLKTIKCTLETKDLWKKFHELGTEMIITKSGRQVSR